MARRRRRVLGIVLGAVVTVVCVTAGVLYALARVPMGGAAAGERLQRMRASPHFRDGRFVNVEPTRVMAGSLLETARMYREPAERTPRGRIPTVRPPADFLAHPPAGGLRVTWLGHSAFILELDGTVILLDPVLYSRSSPFDWIGVKRFFRSPVEIRELPELDAVLISHDHYDHLALDEIRALAPKTRKFIVPLGVGAHLERWGVPPARIVELDWWQEATVGDRVRVVATPARHYSGRGFQRDRTLWASLALIGPVHRVFYSGDTGPSEQFAQVGERLGPFDVAIVKIGAYGRTWPDIHVTPEQALAIHQMVGGRLFMPAHWGTYNLAAHCWYEPADRLVAAAADSGAAVIVPRPGQSVVPAGPPPLERWWDAVARERVDR